MIYDFPDLGQIKMYRESLGISQKTLAQKTGLKRPMIAQIETGRASTNYENVVRIFKYLIEQVGSIQKSVSAVCAEKIISLTPTHTLSQAKEIMREKKFDCIPICDIQLNLKGKITSMGIATLTKSNKDDSEILISDIIEDSPPTVPHNTPVSWITHFLTNPGDCVLVTQKGKLFGIVTLWDLVFKK